MTDLFGQALAPASRSAPPARNVATRMSATYGLRSSGSSASAALQQSLASRLQERLALRGSTMFALTWKAKATPLRRQICQLRASAPRIDGNDFSGWPTPFKEDARSSARKGYMITGNQGTTLLDAARLAEWATPSARDWKDSPGMATTGTNPDGSVRDRTDQLPRQAQMIHGPTSNGSPAPTEKRGQLNPAFPRWLMGYPAGWCEAAIEAWHRMPTKARKRESCD